MALVNAISTCVSQDSLEEESQQDEHMVKGG